MAEIDKKHLDRLTNAGLHVSPPVKAFRDGVWVGKPTSTQGNCVPGYKADGYTIFGEDAPPEMDAPMLKFYTANENSWMVRGEDFAGVKGPGDFANEWKTVEEAIDDIQDFYFGNPSRMLAYTGIIPRTDLNCHLPLYLPNSQSISHPGSIKSDTPSGTFTGPNSSYSSPAQ